METLVAVFLTLLVIFLFLGLLFGCLKLLIGIVLLPVKFAWWLIRLPFKILFG